MGTWGVGSWLLYGFKVTSIYPGTYHATIMIGGFLFLMAVGFLMTAIPAFTDTNKASSQELGMAIFLSLLLAIAGILNQPIIFHRCLLVEMVFLVFYGVKRVLKRKDDPPPTFIFVGFGILCGLCGMAIICLDDIGTVSGNWSMLGHNLFFQGMMLSLVLGVGSRLLPALMGWEEMPLVQITMSNSPKPKFLTNQMWLLLILMIALGLSFFIEAFMNSQIGRTLRALVPTIIAFRFWQLHKLPLEKTWLSRWIWISGWCIVIGLWGYSLFPSYGVHLMHVTFIGGFSLLTLMIATRVTIAHGDEEYDLEGKSRGLKWAGILILAAMVTRVLAPFTMGTYRSHLGYASIMWIFALILWSFVFFKRILFHKSS